MAVRANREGGIWIVKDKITCGSKESSKIKVQKIIKPRIDYYL